MKLRGSGSGAVWVMNNHTVGVISFDCQAFPRALDAMSAALEGPALKKRKRIADVEEGSLCEWLVAQVEDLCTQSQKVAVGDCFAKFSRADLSNMQVEFLEMALRDIITAKADRMRVVSALFTATRPAPAEPVTWL